MKNNNLKKKKVFSFDKTFSSSIFFAQPHEYKSLEDISKDHKRIINAGSNLSYSPLGFCRDGISIDLKKFNRIIELDKEKKKVSLSIKALEQQQTKEAVKKYGSKDSGGVLGEILGPLIKKKNKK